MYILDFFDPEITVSDEKLKPLKEQYTEEINIALNNRTSKCITCDIQLLREKYLKVLLMLRLN